MEKTIAALLVSGALFAPLAAFASTSLTAPSNCIIPPDHGVYADDGVGSKN